MVSYGSCKIIALVWNDVAVVIATNKVGYYSAIAEIHHFSMCQERNALYIEPNMIAARHGILLMV